MTSARFFEGCWFGASNLLVTVSRGCGTPLSQSATSGGFSPESSLFSAPALIPDRFEPICVRSIGKMREWAEEIIMFRAIAAITAVLTTVALLSTATQSVEPVVLLAQDPIQNVTFDTTGAMRRGENG